MESFFPGDRVLVTDGTFIGMQGVVISLDEALRLGGEVPSLKPVADSVWVVLAIFDRPTAVNLQIDQVTSS